VPYQLVVFNVVGHQVTSVVKSIAEKYIAEGSLLSGYPIIAQWQA